MRDAGSEGLISRARQIHADTLVCAAHTDLVGDVVERHSRGEQHVLGRRHAADFRGGGIRCVSEHVVGDTFETQSFPTRQLLHAFYGGRLYNPSMLKHSLTNLSYMLADLNESWSDFGPANSVAEIRAHAAAGRIAMVLCTQGLTCIEDEPALLELYHRLGIRVLGLATYRGNAAVGSYPEGVDYGLTPLGKDILNRAQRLKMVVDVASVSQRGFRDVLTLASGPVIASHTNAHALCPRGGNLNDAELREVAQTGGLVAPIANGTIVSTKPHVTLSDFVDHIDHMVECMGADHVAIGPDIVEDSHYPLEAYRRMFADEGYWSTHYPEGFSSHRELPNVTAELLRRGYAETDIRKILGENLLRVYSTVWGG